MPNWQVVNPVKYMNELVPQEFWRASLLALREATRVATAQTADLAPERRSGTFGWIRRSQFEQRWEAIAKRYGGKATLARNTNLSSYHTEVRFGGLLFTSYAIQSTGEFPREAEYRDTLAAGTQLYLAFIEEAPPPQDAEVYGLLLYSSDSEENGLPLFARVGFPDRKMKKFVATHSFHPLLKTLGEESTLEKIHSPIGEVSSEMSSTKPRNEAFNEETVKEPSVGLRRIRKKDTSEDT